VITLTVTAECHGCGWTVTGPGRGWDAIQRQADRHLAPGHPVSVTATPATTTDVSAAAGPGAAQQEGKS
jgi:hypothetical protein